MTDYNRDPAHTHREPSSRFDWEVPLVFFPANVAGGALKSMTMVMLAHRLKALGYDPIIVALDTNESFVKMLVSSLATRKSVGDRDAGGQPLFLTEFTILTWDLNSQADADDLLFPILEMSIREKRPVLFDFPAKGGDSGGVNTLLRTGVFEHTNLVAVAPCREDIKHYEGILEALEDIAPARWMRVLYADDRARRAKHPMLEAIDAMKPDSQITIPLLTEKQAPRVVSELPVILPKLAEYIACSGFVGKQWQFAANYWEACIPELDRAIRETVPELPELKTAREALSNVQPIEESVTQEKADKQPKKANRQTAES